MPRSWFCSTTPTTSRRPPSAARPAATVLASLAVLAACSPPSARDLPRAALNEAIAHAIGDPATCVLLADRATGRVVYTYGDASSCSRALPACDRQGTLRLADTLRLIAHGPRTASCESGPGTRVGWAAGPAPGSRSLNYAAVMEGARALPGVEIQARLADAFFNARL